MRLKVFAAVTVNGELLLTTALPLLRVTGPVAVPAAIANVTEVCDALDSVCPIVPPPCLGMDTCGADPKLVPVIVTRVPIGPDVGLKFEIAGAVPEPVLHPKPKTASLTI